VRYLFGSDLNLTNRVRRQNAVYLRMSCG
jgi:hypothetical protein